MGVRLFVAVYPPAEVLADLRSVLAPVRAEWPALRWSPEEQWHLTLAFFADVDEARVGALAERLGRAAARCAPMWLRLARFGAFPSARRARVCWVGVEGAPDAEPPLAADGAAGDGGEAPRPDAVAELRQLAARCAAAGRRVGIEVDDKPYRPHVTVARPRQPPLDVSPLVEAFAGHAGPPWLAGEVRLVRSHLGAQVRHEPLAAWRLSDPR